MSGRRGGDGFRADPRAVGTVRLGGKQRVALVLALVVVAASVTIAATLTRPSRAKTFDLFYGSLFLDDKRAPVAVDLADGKATIRLVNANAQVAAKSESGVDVVPLDGATLLLNKSNGEFNVVRRTGFVIKTGGGGVALPGAAAARRAAAVASGASAYVVQTRQATTSVYLVDEATVQSARRGHSKVTPRASATVPAVGTGDPGAAASANGNLWLLTHSGRTDTIRQLSLPKGSSAGAELTGSSHGTVSGAAAIEAATRDADGSGGDVVAVASATGVRIFDAGTERTLPLTGLSGVDQILPTSNSNGRLSFLYHSSGGWSQVSAPAEDGPLPGPLPLASIPADARLAPPAASAGASYTMDRRSNGTLWRITGKGASPVPDASHYPIVRSGSGAPQETTDFSDAQVLARGARVVFNSPDHERALTVFTDGSHKPVIVDKSAAVDLNAAGGAAAVTTNLPTKGQPTAKPNPVAPPAAPVDNQVKCQNTTQVPHIPTITQATPASRSVLLRWSYPLLDSQDCVPSTYAVTVKLLGGDAPPAPGRVLVQGHTGVNLTGLFPSSRYQVTVTAYINDQGTPSRPVQITTGREGPAAPTGLRTTVDAAGNWTIAWNSCGGIAQGCVPVASWQLLPRFCDGAQLSGPLAAIPVAGDPTQSHFTATFPGSDATLGRGLSFSVQGIGEHGEVGRTASEKTCSYSWRPPQPGEITLHASTPAKTQLGATTTSTFTLDLGADPVAATGGVGAQFTYALLSGGTVLQTVGPTTATSVTFGDIRAGRAYTGTVLVSPPRHPEAAVTIGPVPISTSSPWPALSVSAQVNAIDDTHDSVAVTVTGLSSAVASGETFDLTSNSALECSNTVWPLTTTNFDPAARPTPIVSTFDSRQLNGSCQVVVRLVEDRDSQTSPPVFGGTVSPLLSTTIAISTPGPLQPTDFAAPWDQPGGAQGPYSVTLKQATGNPAFLFVTSWNETVHDDTDCTSGPAGTTLPAQIGVSVDCVAHPPQTPHWVVVVSYQLIGHGAQTVTVPITGKAPPSPTPTPTPTLTPNTSAHS